MLAGLCTHTRSYIRVVSPLYTRHVYSTGQQIPLSFQATLPRRIAYSLCIYSREHAALHVTHRPLSQLTSLLLLLFFSLPLHPCARLLPSLTKTRNSGGTLSARIYINLRADFRRRRLIPRSRRRARAPLAELSDGQLLLCIHVAYVCMRRRRVYTERRSCVRSSSCVCVCEKARRGLKIRGKDV